MKHDKTNIPAPEALSSFIETIAKLRDPKSGCPWDLKQTHSSLRPYAIEEAYELVEAIELKNDEELKKELGDVLLQVALHAQIASERGAFSFTDVIQAVNEKMIFRHPHVFGNSEASTSEEVLKQWEELKAKEHGSEKANSLSAKMQKSGKSLPALERASKIGTLAAETGFDWQSPEQVLEKVEEELFELKAAISEHKNKKNSPHIAEELGDLLFATSQLSRHLKLSPEVSLSDGINKFIKRFSYLEPTLSELGENAPLEELENAWQKAKLASQEEG